MRNLTRFLAMALTILMIAGCFSVAALAYADGPFVNYDDEIAIMSEMGLLKGYAGTDNFGYGNNITRREACILFARVLTGRTDAEYAAANFMGDVNNTGFADLDATGDFYGAINLAKNENLIIGYTEDGVEKFNPNGTITYQDFLTICVRLLYSSFDDTETIEKLNAGYPWSYINRAKALDITTGIVDIVKNGDAITRGVAAKAVYNTLFEAPLPTGDWEYEILAEKYFGANVVKGTVVLTGIDGYQKTEQPLPAVGGYATVATINPDGTLEPVPALRLPVVELLGEELAEEAYNYVGASFDVVTINGFKSLVKSTMNDRVVIKDSAVISNLVINKVKYTLVDAYTFPIIADGNNWYGNTELILKDLEYGFATITDATVLKPFEKDEVYYAPKYAELVGYDDNDDGVLDRAYYADFSVGVLGTATEKDFVTTKYPAEWFDGAWDQVDPNGNNANERVYTITTGVWGDEFATGSWDDPWGDPSEEGYGYSYSYGIDNRANAKDGDVVLWYYNPVADMIVVDKVYAVETGVVTGYDFDAKTVTIMPTAESGNFWYENYGKGTTYSYAGIFNLDGATSVDQILGEQGTTAIRESLNQQVKFVLDDGVIIGFWGNTPADDYYIFDKFINVDMNGYMNIQVMNADGLYEIIAINTINNKPYYILDLEVLGFAKGDVVRVVSDKVTGRLNVLFNNLEASGLVVEYDGEEDNAETYYKIDDMWWASEDAATEFHESKGGKRGGQNRELPKRLIIEDELMGLVVVDIANAKDYATISFNYDLPAYEIAEGVWYFRNGRQSCHEVPATLGYWGLKMQHTDAGDVCIPATTEKIWGTNGVSTGNVWDVVYFDGSLDSSITSTTNKYGVVYTYVDKANNMGGFFSLVKAQDEDVKYVVKSFNRTMDAGFYTLIKDVDGNIWFGDEIDARYVFDVTAGLTRTELTALYPTASYTLNGIKTNGTFRTLSSDNNYRDLFRDLTGDKKLNYNQVNMEETTFTVYSFHADSVLDSLFYVDHGITDQGQAASNKPFVFVVCDGVVLKPTVTIDSEIENGTVTADKTMGMPGDTVTLTVTPDAGYEIDTVTVDGTAITANAGVYSFDLGDDDVVVSATFVATTTNP